MKLLTREELKGIESTTATIEKWNEFLKEAVWNLGYRQSLIDNMFPYEKGIPLDNGSTLPVDSTTGRVFFKMSWADKLCAMLSAFNMNSYRYGTGIDSMKYVLARVWGSSLPVFQKFFPDEPEDIYNILSALSKDNVLANSSVNKLFKRFIQESDIIYSTAPVATSDYDRGSSSYPATFKLEDEDKERLLTDSQHFGTPGAVLFIYNEALENEYSPSFPTEAFLKAAKDVVDGYNPWSKLVNYTEVYLQDYLVISLNPVDKLMCSTKQAFASCMSIARQNDTKGTNSAAALGLPSIFPTDAIYMIFMTPGKHKNMYWETEEWEKVPEERDKEKAYKYLKMTCRALTYKVTATSQYEEQVENIKAQIPKLTPLLDELHLDRPRLLVGRQYAAKGEDYVWEVLIEVLMARQGICTSYGTYAEVFGKIQRRTSVLNLLKCLGRGNLTDNKFICTDRYGFLRGIYYDNINIQYSSEYIETKSRYGGSYVSSIEWPASEYGEHIVTSGIGRYGTHGVLEWSLNARTDMFKVMTGKMKYQEMNQCVTLCDFCDDVLDANDMSNILADGRRICHHCAEKHKLIRCEGCGKLYTEEQKDEHEIFNLRELTNPHNFEKFPPILVCKSHLNMCSTTNESRGTFICAHCGKIHTRSYYNQADYTTVTSFKGIEIKVDICESCIQKAVMCDKCKRVLFLNETQDACLLLPNRRVICPDCIDNIRMQQTKRKILQDVLKELKAEDIRIEEQEDCLLEDKVARRMESAGRQVGKPNTLIKDVVKQIRSYLQNHPEKDFPRLRAALPSEEMPEELICIER